MLHQCTMTSNFFFRYQKNAEELLLHTDTYVRIFRNTFAQDHAVVVAAVTVVVAAVAIAAAAIIVARVQLFVRLPSSLSHWSWRY